MRRIFLDHHTVSAPFPEVVHGMQAAVGEVCALPSGIHREAKSVRAAIEKARGQLLGFVEASDADSQVVFTGSGTEAVNLAVLGFARANRRFGKHLLSSPIEHPSVMNSLQALESEGFQWDRISVDTDGRFDLASIQQAITEETLLICLHLANHDVGTIQALCEVGEWARERSIEFFVDATAAGGRVPIDVGALNASLLALSPSTFGGPLGVGVLYKQSRVVLEPLYYGGDQEHGLRPGDENVVGIIGAGLAAESMGPRIGQSSINLRRLQAQLWEKIQAHIGNVRLLGAPLGEGRLCHQLCLTVEGVDAEGLVLFADMRGLAISASGGCLSRSLDRHYVLSELGVGPEAGKQTIGLGVGLQTSEDDLEQAVEILAAGVERLRSMSPSWSR